MRWSVAIPVVCALATACSQPAPAPQPQTQQKPAEPSAPPEITAVAEKVLGAEAEVLAFGDLARAGSLQALVVNRLKKNPTGTVPGILLTRGAIVSREGGKWKEVFLCDEHLKNPKGFLAGTPTASVSGWRLQYEQNPEKGLQMYFTPLQQPRGGYILTIGVRWNRKVNRYQSLDSGFEHFLGELPALEGIHSRLRQ